MISFDLSSSFCEVESLRDALESWGVLDFGDLSWPVSNISNDITPLENKWVEPENILYPLEKEKNIFQIFIFGFNMLVFWGCFPAGMIKTPTLMGLGILLDDLPWNEDQKNEMVGRSLMPFNMNNRDHVFHFCRHLDQYSTVDDVPPPIVVETYLSLSNLCRKYLGSSKCPSDAYTFIYQHLPREGVPPFRNHLAPFGRSRYNRMYLYTFTKAMCYAQTFLSCIFIL